jgi:hypothetical protein
MRTVIDRRAQMIVDKSTFDEIQGAVAVDLDTGVVEIVKRAYGGDVHSSQHFPAGLKIMSRYPR